MRRFLCSLVGHRRDAKRARPSIDGWRSSCILCGERMVRLAPGQWCLVKDRRRPIGSLAVPRQWCRPHLHCSGPDEEFDRSRWVVRDLFEVDG